MPNAKDRPLARIELKVAIWRTIRLDPTPLTETEVAAILIEMGHDLLQSVVRKTDKRRHYRV